jgi:regulator of protease activity HflC (stomatin/prohibitin superfamily)
MDAAEKSFGLIPWIVVVLVLGAVVLPQMIRILREYERGVIFRLGKLLGAKGPGLILLIPIVDRMVKMDLRVITIDVPKQEVMTRDNVPATVDAVVYFRVVDPQAAVVKVENFLKASSLIAQTTLRSVLGQSQLDELLAQRDKINQQLQEIIDRHTEPWGVKVTSVEVRDVVLPDSMKRAMAKQAESERERRAKIINAEGEFQAAEKLVQAAGMISAQPIALQLRYLQTMSEIASEHNTTTFIPIPMDLFTPFLKKSGDETAKH